VGLLRPETARSVVGMGADVHRFAWWPLSWFGIIKQRTRFKGVDSSPPLRAEREKPSRSAKAALRSALKNFLNCFRIVFYRDTFLTVWMHGSFYTAHYSFVAALPDIFGQVYGYNELHIGLAYLPRGVGIIIGSYCTGKLMDYNYQATIRE